MSIVKSDILHDHITWKPMFRIQERKYASNIIEKAIKKEGSKEITWIPYLAPLENKKKGDKVCEMDLKGLMDGK